MVGMAEIELPVDAEGNDPDSQNRHRGEHGETEKIWEYGFHMPDIVRYRLKVID